MKKVVLLMADITSIAVDAMVNSANASLLAGSGLCGLIHKKAGDDITQQCKRLFKRDGVRKVASVTLTDAGRLPAKYLLHAVGPRWLDGSQNEAVQLANTYANIISMTDEQHLKTLSIPSISTGIHGFPKQLAAKVALETTLTSLNVCQHIDSVFLVCGDEDNAKVYAACFDELNAGQEDVMLFSFFPTFDP